MGVSTTDIILSKKQEIHPNLVLEKLELYSNVLTATHCVHILDMYWVYIEV